MTVPSPVPASNTRNAGGAGSSAASSAPMRWPIAHFSLHVVTNSRYFSRLSKKRNGRSSFIFVSMLPNSEVMPNSSEDHAGRGSAAPAVGVRLRAISHDAIARFSALNPMAAPIDAV